MQKNTAAKRAALYGLFVAFAMVLGFIESLIPIPVPIPGVKLGLANLATVAGFFLVGIPGTILVTVLRIVLTGLSFGNPYSMLYGLSGSFLSLAVMGIGKKCRWFSPVGISVLGGVFHNIGQLTFAAFVVRTPGVYVYLPFLLAAGCVTGIVIGVLGGSVASRLERWIGRAL